MLYSLHFDIKIYGTFLCLFSKMTRTFNMVYQKNKITVCQTLVFTKRLPYNSMTLRMGQLLKKHIVFLNTLQFDRL